MYGKKSRGSKILATRGRGDFVKFYLAPPKMRVAPQMPPQIPRPGAATAHETYQEDYIHIAAKFVCPTNIKKYT